MKNLQRYLDEKINFWNELTGRPEVTLPLAEDEVIDLIEDIACNLSPENLHCDGEASITHVRAKVRYLDQVKKQLDQYCLDNCLDTPELMY